MQELRLASARLAMWGSITVDLHALASTVSWLLQSDSYHQRSGHDWFPTPACLGGGEIRRFGSFERAMACLHQRQATDPRDKVCGFLDLLQDRESAKTFKVLLDYSKPVLQAYVDILTTFIQESSKLNILSKTYLDEEVLASMQEEHWPSFVSDLKLRAGPNALADYYLFSSACYSESGTRRPNARIIDYPTRDHDFSLTVKGYTVDTVSTISDHLSDASEGAITAQSHVDFYDYVSAAWRKAQNSVSIDDFVETIIRAVGSHWEETSTLNEMKENELWNNE
jgi:hypothetical protein